MADIPINIVFADAHKQFLIDGLNSDPEMEGVPGTDLERARYKIESLIKKWLKERKDDVAIQTLSSQFSQDKQTVKDTELPVDIISVT